MTQLQEAKTKPKLPWAEASDKIAAIIGESGDAVRKEVADALKANPESQYVMLKRGLSTDQFLKLRALDLAYLWPLPRSVRVYPNGAVAGNLIGFIAGNGDKEGLEEAQNQCLSATKGKESYLVGKDGVVIPGSQSETPAVDGGTVKLTINTELQWYLQQMISEEVKAQGAKAGTVTVVEVGTGKIRAAAEYPSVDPQRPPRRLGPGRSRLAHLQHELRAGLDRKGAYRRRRHGAGRRHPLDTVTASSHEDFPNGAVINDAFEHPRLRLHARGRAHRLVERRAVEVRRHGQRSAALRRVREVRSRQQDGDRLPPARRPASSIRSRTGTRSRTTRRPSASTTRSRRRRWPASIRPSPTAA